MSVAIVTGGRAEIGREVAAKLGTMGFRVGHLDDSDLAERARAIAAVNRLVSELGPASVLVTCPSARDGAPFGELGAERWQRLLHAHLGTTLNACAAAVPAMVEARRGTVITMSSWLAYAGVAGESYQAAATGSVLAFTKSF